MSNYMVRTKVAFMVDDLNPIGYPQPVGNAASVAPQRAIAKAQAYVFLMDAVSESDLTSLIANYDADKDDADKLEIHPDPVKLWAAMQLHAKGAIVDISGSELHDRIQQWQWPARAGDGSYVSQVITAIAELREFCAQAALIEDGDYPFSEAMACHAFRSKMPTRMQREYVSYESLRRLHELKEYG